MDLSTVAIRQKIYSIRKHRVMLDSDLALFYEVDTKRLNEQVKRNLRWFTEDLMFQLTSDEFATLSTQAATPRLGRGGRRHLPYLFTEHGAVFLSNFFTNDRAKEVHIAIARTFSQFRKEAEEEEIDIKSRLDNIDSQLKQILRYQHSPLDWSRPKPQLSTRVPLCSSKHSKVVLIKNRVAHHFSLEPRDLTKSTRKRTIAFPRQIAMYFIRNYLCLSYLEISSIFGLTDHTTVIHACKRIRIQRESNQNVMETLRIIQMQLETCEIRNETPTFHSQLPLASP